MIVCTCCQRNDQIIFLHIFEVYSFDEKLDFVETLVLIIAYRDLNYYIILYNDSC